MLAGCIYFINVMQLCYSIYVTQFKWRCISARCMSAVVLLHRCMHCKFASLIILRETKYQSITMKQSISHFLWNKNQSWTKISINYYETKYWWITMNQNINQTGILSRLGEWYFLNSYLKYVIKRNIKKEHRKNIS